MNRTATIVVLFLVGGFAASFASAQHRARGPFEKVGRYAEEVNSQLSKRRNDTPENRLKDEPNLYRTAGELRDMCRTACDALSRFGDQLASAASGEHESRLREPKRLAGMLIYQVQNELLPKCEELRTLINTDERSRGSNFESKLEGVMTAVVIGARKRSSEFLELEKKSEETMRWLQDSLQRAQAMRDDSAKPGAALNQGKQQLEARINDHTQELRRASDQVRDAEARHLDAASRCREAANAHDAARSAAPGSSYLSNHVAAYQRWLAAEKVQRDAAKVMYDAYVQLERVVADGKTRLVDLARSMYDIERYGDQANPEKVTRRWNEFDQWTKLFTFDISG